MADGTITFSTELDNTQLEADLKKTEKEVETLKRKVEKSESDRNAIADKLTKAREEASKTEAEITRLAERLKELDALAETDPAGAQARAEVVTEEFVKQAKLYDQQQTKIAGLEDKWGTLDGQTKKYTADLEAARQKQAALGAEYAKTMRGKGLTDGIRAVEGRMDAFANKITKTMKKVFVFGMIAKGIKTIKSYLGEALAENERFQASWGNLKATIQGVANFVAAGLAPILTGFVNMVAAMITTLASLVDSIFKTNIAQAIQHAKQAAQATDKQAKSTKKLGKAAKEASRQLMSFDEINAMNADTSNDAADALDDEAEAEAPALNWDAFDVGKIDAKLAEIMLIIGAALLAIGAILCFSGINIPLGITLMAIGALMIYTAYREQWDKLPQDVRNAITAALVLTGIVLLVIGAVLAFSGINIPLGVGLMAAGAALLVTALGLNWNALPPEVQGVVTAIMVIVGAALLVIGAILALSGANIPVGVALIAAGALLLVTAAVLNWEEMTDEIRGVVLAIAAIVSVALLVIGGVLAFSGANLPLGIALMAAGALGLVAVAALSWDALPEDIRRTVGQILAIVGAALLALGIILCAAGVSMPLGIALIAAGAVSLAAAAALNWDLISGNVEETITTILLAAGAALLALGLILCVAGFSLPLGIALIAAGAASLAAAAVLNWDKMTDETRDTIATVLRIAGAALLALGIILCVTGVALPLGVALIAAGAAALVLSAVLSWDTMPDKVKETISTIAGYAGAALLVLGIILCVTGVGIPLGIACIVAGVGALVVAAALNWDFFKDKIADIWEGIKAFWRDNIAQVFTLQFWENLFKCIVNGLIWAINLGITCVENFINLFTDGIASILDWLGVEGWSFRITLPKIPYLAQGAVIPPNRKFMAVLGDQTSGNNLEAPESLIRQIVREEAGNGVDAATMQQAFAAALMQVLPMLQQPGGSDGDAIMVLRVGNEELARAVNKGNASMMRRGLIDPNLGFA